MAFVESICAVAPSVYIPSMMKHMPKIFRSFYNNESGTVAVLGGALCVVLLVAAGVAIDFGRGFNTNRDMQHAVDASALAAAGMDDEATKSDQTAFAKEIFDQNYGEKHTGLIAPVVSFGDETVTVSAATDMATTLMQVAKTDKVAIGVSATAWRGPRHTICVLALDPTSPGGLNIRGTGQLTLEECAAQTNSNDRLALLQEGTKSNAAAESFCSHGGVGGINFTPKPYKYCSRADDPFKDLPVPTKYGCDYRNTVYKNGIFEVGPGTFCGGINIEAHADVTFKEGLYVVDGEFRIAAHSVVKGYGVTFYLIGNKAKLTIVSHADVDLVAPSFGDYAGVLFAQDAAANPGETSAIEGGADITLIGATYLPTQILNVSSTSTFGGNSPFFPLVAWRIDYSGGSETIIKYDPSALGGGFEDIKMPKTRPMPRLIN